ncbi:MAG: endonuclease/exonuclease/phosphatase family protein [Thermoanaerobaculales bacterium]
MGLWLSAAALGSASVVAAQAVEIWEIQGDGMSSPIEGQQVTTQGNVVTAVGEDLFFIQTPDARSDGDPWTSDGIVVDLGRAPDVVLGDLVDVSGSVREWYNQTEIAGGPTVTVVSSAHQLPTPVEFGPSVPSPFQPWPETELERFEGMLVRVEGATVSAPTDRFGEACVVAAPWRLFREPGIVYPGLPNLAVWDGNPEAFELDPLGLGGDPVELAAGSIVRAEGVLAFAYGAYQLWPTSLELISEPDLPGAARLRRFDEAVVATQNLFRLGESGGAVPYATRLQKLSIQVREVLRAPDVLAVQEVMDLETLQELADRIATDDPSLAYTPFLEEGNDFGGIDVGFLVRDTVRVVDTEQVGKDVRFSWDGSRLHDRPPLVMVAELPGFSAPYTVTLVVVHLRSLGGIDDPDDGERVRRKRFEQSVWLSEWIQDRQTADPGEQLIVLGDFNAFEFSDGYVDVVGQITGQADLDGALLPATDEVAPELTDWVLALPRQERYSYVYRCSAQVLDHILTSRSATPWVRSVAHPRGNADAPVGLADDPSTAARSSDHDGLLVFLGPRTRSGGGPRRQPVDPRLLAVHRRPQ